MNISQQCPSYHISQYQVSLIAKHLHPHRKDHTRPRWVSNNGSKPRIHRRGEDIKIWPSQLEIPLWIVPAANQSFVIALMHTMSWSMGFNLTQLSFGKGGWQGNNAYLAYLLGGVCCLLKPQFELSRCSEERIYRHPKILCGFDRRRKKYWLGRYILSTKVSLSSISCHRRLFVLDKLGDSRNCSWQAANQAEDLQALWEVTSRKGNSLWWSVEIQFNILA